MMMRWCRWRPVSLSPLPSPSFCLLLLFSCCPVCGWAATIPVQITSHTISERLRIRVYRPQKLPGTIVNGNQSGGGRWRGEGEAAGRQAGPAVNVDWNHLITSVVTKAQEMITGQCGDDDYTVKKIKFKKVNWLFWLFKNRNQSKCYCT